MNKLIHSCLIVSIIAFTPMVHTNEVPTDESMQPEFPSKEPDVHASPKKHTDDTDSTETSTVPESYPEEAEEEGTPVGQAANEGSKAAKRRHWQNIALATAAVVVAVTALVLVANNDGHRSDD